MPLPAPGQPPVPSDPAGPSVRRRSLTAALVAVGIAVCALATVVWTEADREARVLCGLVVAGTPVGEVERVLGTAEMLQLRPEGVELAAGSAFSFDAVATLRTTRCAVSLGPAGVTRSTLTRAVPLERVAALGAGILLLFLCLFQVGLATGRVSGRMAWGGRFETLPPSHRRASAVSAVLLPPMAWVLLERAAVVDLVPGDGAVAAGAWAITVFFLLSTAGNLASASPPERRLGIPVATAVAILSWVVAYAG